MQELFASVYTAKIWHDRTVFKRITATNNLQPAISVSALVRIHSHLRIMAGYKHFATLASSDLNLKVIFGDRYAGLHTGQ